MVHILFFGGHGIVAGGLAERTAEGRRVGTAFREEDPVNKVVARFADGRMVKGLTADFFPAKDLWRRKL